MPAVRKLVCTPVGAGRVPFRREFTDHATVPDPFTVTLVDGVATFDLAATESTWCWEVTETVDVAVTHLEYRPVPMYTRHVAVPDSVSVLEYSADLIDLDPDTLDPAAVAPAAWTTALAAETASRVALAASLPSTYETLYRIDVQHPPAPLMAAVGDGVTDDTAALQAIFDLATDTYLPRIHIPSGTYRITSTLRIREAIVIDGDHGHRNVDATTISLDSTDSIPAIQIGRDDSTEMWNVTIRQISVERASFDTTDGVNNTLGSGIFFDNVSEANIQDVSVAGFGVGLDLKTSSIMAFERCYIHYNGIGLSYRSGTGTVAFRDSNWWQNGTGVNLESHQIEFDSCHFERCSVATFNISAGSANREVWGVTVSNCNIRNYVAGAHVVDITPPAGAYQLFIYMFKISNSLLMVNGCPGAIEIRSGGGGYQSVDITLEENYIRGVTAAVNSPSSMTVRSIGKHTIRTNADGSGSNAPIVSGSAKAIMSGLDTGKRTFSGTQLTLAADAALNGAVTWMQRAGSTVTLHVSLVGPTGGMASGTWKVTIPNGFKPSGDLVLKSYVGVSCSVKAEGSVNYYSALGAGVVDYITATYQTSDVWPTTLPGS